MYKFAWFFSEIIGVVKNYPDEDSELVLEPCLAFFWLEGVFDFYLTIIFEYFGEVEFMKGEGVNTIGFLEFWEIEFWADDFFGEDTELHRHIGFFYIENVYGSS